MLQHPVCVCSVHATENLRKQKNHDNDVKAPLHVSQMRHGHERRSAGGTSHDPRSNASKREKKRPLERAGLVNV